MNVGPTVNSEHWESLPSVSGDGLLLLFGDGNPFGYPPRPGGQGHGDIWMTTRTSDDDEWTTPVNLGPSVNSGYGDGYPNISANGLSLHFGSNRPNGLGGWADLWLTTRDTRSAPWGEPVNLGEPVNSSAAEGLPYLTADGLSLLLYSTRFGGYGGVDLWMTTRASTEAEWETPVNLGPTINSSYYDISPCVTPDFPAVGSSLFFARGTGSGWSSDFTILQSTVVGEEPSLTWDGLGDGNWTDIDPQTGYSRWVDSRGNPVDYCPEDVISVVINANSVSLAEHSEAHTLVVDDAVLSIAPTARLNVTDDFAMLGGCEYVCQLGAT
ncbi:MAG: PD40 domain-containing protein, partial [Gemmatimonadota bacterium]